jgi:hypothetical protein
VVVEVEEEVVVEVVEVVSSRCCLPLPVDVLVATSA